MDGKLRPPSFYTVTAQVVRKDPAFGRIIFQRLSRAEKVGVAAVLARSAEQKTAQQGQEEGK